MIKELKPFRCGRGRRQVDYIVTALSILLPFHPLFKELEYIIGPKHRRGGDRQTVEIIPRPFLFRLGCPKSDRTSVALSTTGAGGQGCLVNGDKREESGKEADDNSEDEGDGVPAKFGVFGGGLVDYGLQQKAVEFSRSAHLSRWRRPSGRVVVRTAMPDVGLGSQILRDIMQVWSCVWWIGNQSIGWRLLSSERRDKPFRTSLS